MTSSYTVVEKELQKNKLESSTQDLSLEQKKTEGYDEKASGEYKISEQDIELLNFVIKDLKAYVAANSHSQDSVTRKKMGLASDLSDNLLDIKDQLTEEYNNNSQAPAISLIFYLLLSKNEHQDILKEALAEKSKKFLSDWLGSFIGKWFGKLIDLAKSYFPKSIETLSAFLYYGKLGQELGTRITFLNLKFPKESDEGIKLIKRMVEEDAKKTLFPEIISHLDTYLTESALKKSDPLTAKKITIISKLKAELIKRINNDSNCYDDTQYKQDPTVNDLIKSILEAKEEHEKILSHLWHISSKYYLGDSIGGFLDYYLNKALGFAAGKLYNGKTGPILDEAIQSLENKIPGSIDTAKKTNTKIP